MKETNRQPRRFRRAARRVVMWAALVMAIGIGVVWAGGERTKWEWSHVSSWRESGLPKNGPLEVRSAGIKSLRVSGRLGGMEFRHEVMRFGAFGGFIILPPRAEWIWKPMWTGERSNWGVAIPYWIPTLLCVATFALLFRVERREKQLARAGHCVCGYSLAGLADGAVCPECGKGKTLT